MVTLVHSWSVRTVRTFKRCRTVRIFKSCRGIFTEFYEKILFWRKSAPHKRVNVEVEKLLYSIWEFCHNPMHSAAMILNPAYCNAKLTQNKDVMADL